MARFGFDPFLSEGAQRGYSPEMDPFQSEYDEALTSAYSNNSAVVPYLKNNTQNKLDESLTWGEMFDAAWTGAKTGVGSYAPERFYRAMRTIGTMLGSDGLQDWAAQGIEETVRERSEDPWYKPDETWMKKEWGRALYEGFANHTAGLVTMAPGVAASLLAVPVAAGTGIGALLLTRGAHYLSGAAFSNLLMGFSEFDSFVDEAHSELSRIDPGLTRDTVRGEKFWQAALSGVIEGGIGMASDAIGGTLTGIVGNNSARSAGHLVTRLIRNTYSNVITEMGEEAATAYIQDYAREIADLDYEGRWKAIQNIIKPTLVGGILGGGTKTAMGAMQGPVNETQAPVDIDTDGMMMRERMGKAREALSPHGFELMQSLSAVDGTNHRDSLSVVTALDSLANRLAGESGQGAADIFKTLDARDPSLHRLVQAIQSKEAGLDTVAAESFDFLYNRLTPEAKEGIARAYPGDGEAVESFGKFLRNGNEDGLSEGVRFGFSAMKDVLSDVVSATGSNSRLSVNQEVFKTLQEADGATSRAPEAPAVFRDDVVFQQALEGIEGGAVDPARVAGAVNFDSLTGHGPETAAAAFQQWERAIAPLLEKVADTKRRRPDARVFRAAQQEMEGGPGLAKMAEYFDKAYGGDKALVVMDKILDVAGAKVEELAARFELDQSLENSLHLAVMAEQYQMMQNFRQGTASEAGRMLRMSRISRNDPRYADKIAASIQGLGGAKKLENMATAILNAKNAEERNVVIESASKAKTSDMFVEYVTAGMLWSPSTHVVNALSNATNVFKGVFEKFYAEKTNTTGTGIAAGETMAYMTGLWQGVIGLKRMWGKHRAEQGGLMSAVSNLGDAWNHTEYGFAEMIDSGDMRRSITGNNLEAATNRQLDRVGLSNHHWQMSDGFSGVVDFFGRLVNLPFDALEHSDKVFKNITYVAELHAQIHRAAGGDADTMNRMLAKPPEDLKSLSMKHAKEMTFQQDMGKVGNWVNQMRNDYPALRLFLPFLKTPINILKEGISMTPYANKVLGDFQDKLKSSDPAVRQMAEAKLMTGQLLWGTAVMLASAGFLTGPGPENADERRKQLATGKRFNAIKIGDSYYQIDRLDPLAAVFNSAAFATEIVNNVDQQDFTKAMLMGLGQTMRLFTNRTYVESFGDIVSSIMEPERKAGDLIRRFGGMLVPASALGRTLNRTDPFMREAGDLQSAMMQNIPGLSQYLPERRDFLGQPIRSAEYAGPTYLSPFQVGRENKDKVYQEINRLHGLGLSAAPMPGRSFTRNGMRIEMDPVEYAQFLERYGNKTQVQEKTLMQWLRGFVASPDYRSLSDEDKANRINLAARKYATQARNEIFQASSRIQKQYGVKQQGWEYLLGNIVK